MAAALRQHGVADAVALQAVSQEALQQWCDLVPPAARALLELAHGRDPCVPRHKPPPKVLSLQMTLTPVAIPFHPSWSADSSASAINGGSHDGMLHPLFLDDSDAHTRMMSLLQLMLRDLLVRVVQDRCVHVILTCLFLQ